MVKFSAFELTSALSESIIDVHIRCISHVYGTLLFWKKTMFSEYQHFVIRGAMEPKEKLITELEEGNLSAYISVYRHICGELECRE